MTKQEDNDEWFNLKLLAEVASLEYARCHSSSVKAAMDKAPRAEKNNRVFICDPLPYVPRKKRSSATRYPRTTPPSLPSFFQSKRRTKRPLMASDEEEEKKQKTRCAFRVRVCHAFLATLIFGSFLVGFHITYHYTKFIVVLDSPSNRQLTSPAIEDLPKPKPHSGNTKYIPPHKRGIKNSEHFAGSITDDLPKPKPHSGNTKYIPPHKRNIKKSEHFAGSMTDGLPKPSKNLEHFAGSVTDHSSPSPRHVPIPLFLVREKFLKEFKV